jgi:hypothetical protein
MKSKILLVLAVCTFAAAAMVAQPNPTITVNCTLGQSLNATLSKLPRQLPVTVMVKGTCTEYVTINGFDSLTLKGLPGATLQQPGTTPGGGVPVYVLLIEASRSITIAGFAIHSNPSALAAVAIGRNSIDVQLRDLTVDGGSTFGFFMYEESQVSLARVTARDAGFSTLGAYDISDVHIEQSLFENTTTTGSHWGLSVGSGHVTMQSTTIRNMQFGIDINERGDVNIQSFNSYYPVVRPNDVLIDNPEGSNYQGVKISGNSSLSLGDTKLRINNAGQPFGSNTAAVWVFESSTLSDWNGNLIISGSQGQGIFVSNSAHASIAGSTVTGGSHGGLVAVNQSSIWVVQGNAPTLVGGNATDVFCDSTSYITGGAHLAGVPTTNCGNLQPDDTVPLP